MAAIMAMTASPPTTPPAMAPTLVEDAGFEFEVGVGIVVPDIDAVVEVDVVVLEEVEVLEDCRGDAIELMVVATLVKLEVDVDVAVTVAVGTVMTVARLVTSEVASVVVAGTPTMGYPFIEQ